MQIIYIQNTFSANYVVSERNADLKLKSHSHSRPQLASEVSVFHRPSSFSLFESLGLVSLTESSPSHLPQASNSLFSRRTCMRSFCSAALSSSTISELQVWFSENPWANNKRNCGLIMSKIHHFRIGNILFWAFQLMFGSACLWVLF